LPVQIAVTEEGAAQVRQKRSELFSKWQAVPPGDTIELPFEL
jgi:hypothetical protein